MKKIRTLWFLTLVSSLLSVHASGIKTVSEKNNTHQEMKVRMVLFTPADYPEPENYIKRYKELADYSEAFFKKWMNHWDYPCESPLRIDRDSDGNPIVLVIKGQYNYDHENYKSLSGIRKEVVIQAKENYNIEDDNQVWWILNYPKRKRGCRGGGNSINGGTCFANFIEAEGNITINDDLAAGLPEKILMKSMIHEMSHALGLGHIGPKDSDDLGNTLMGPINKAYKKSYNNDSRVYLSEAAAAILWKHPLFEGDPKEQLKLPSVELKNVKVVYNKKRNLLNLKGKLVSDSPAHSVVILNASEGDKSPYWHKAFASKIDNKGNFNCIISELKDASGELVIGFCFDNGTITGNGEKPGLRSSGIRVPYTYENNSYLIEKAEH